MTITEANDVNTLLRGVLDQAVDDELLDAAKRLADRANKALGAGYTGETFEAALLGA